ncbi:FecCD family ABC transporter permease [Paenibacillus turpanensis]|uniref:FecCD family ABC transporter permease n=1 Tax=Paenibacillus turpanensis TaxID=2689078 RepID=UPI00140CC8FF|nr:iron ABC transporter permease [Paenibacillus turpanensis]
MLICGLLLLAVCMLASMLLGYQRFGIKELWEAGVRFNGSAEHLLLRTVRLPTTLIGAAVGASLAVAGALMQTLSKNPLASPSVLGINAGAVLMIAIVLAATGADLSSGQLIWFAFAGAGVTAVFVSALGAAGSRGFEPVKLTLAGAAVAAFASAITSGLMLLNEESLQETLFWLVGSVSGRKLEHLSAVAPYLGVGLVAALLLARSLNVMGMDDDIAKSLGQWTSLAKGAVIAVVIVLAGGSVALAGPIAFVGLIVPHICRYLVGSDHRWLLPYCAVAGAILLVAADTASRFLLMPKEVPVGVTTALLGVPFLIYLSRRRMHE